MSEVSTSPTVHESRLVDLMPFISGQKRIPATTSLKVAEVFSKRHGDVLRNISQIKANCPESFNERNFAPVDYTDAKGEKRPAYILSRDGFTLLVMGYTGNEAFKYKLAYIEAFNAMERELSERHAPQVDPEQLSTNQSRKPLRSLVSAWAQMTGCPHSTLWPQVKAHFQLESIKDLPEAWIPDALAFVQAKIDALSAGLPEPEPALPALPVIPEGARMELEAIDKRKESAAWVADQCLQKALAHLDHAFQHAGLMANTGNCPIEGYRPSLYIAAMSNINSAAAIVRAMISAEGVRLR